MLEIQRIQLDKAINILNVLGVQYTYAAEDGELRGPLATELIHKDQIPKPKRRSYDFIDLKGMVLDMAVGEVRRFDFTDGLPEGFTAQDVGGRVATLACQTWGAGSFSYRTDGAVIECIRLK